MSADASTTFDPVDFLERAVAVPSHEAVGPMRELLVAELEANGVDATVDDAGNVLAARGTGSPHVVLNTHVDTVPPHVPFSRDGDVIRGRGSCDAKGPLAALLAAFLGAPSDGRLTLAVTPDEETASSGAAALDLSADAIVVGEPTGLDVCTAARGRFEAVVTVRGESAHAAEAATGRNAVAALGPILAAVASFDAERGSEPHETLGAPSLTPTVVRGGEARNQVPAEATLVLDRRSVPPETEAGFFDALADHLGAAAPADVDVTVAPADRGTPFLGPFATDPDAAIVRALSAASGGAVRPFTAATEASYFAELAPTVVFGPGDLVDGEGPVAHADREYVRASEVVAAADALTEALERLGG